MKYKHFTECLSDLRPSRPHSTHTHAHTRTRTHMLGHGWIKCQQHGREFQVTRASPITGGTGKEARVGWPEVGKGLVPKGTASHGPGRGWMQVLGAGNARGG